MKSSKNCQVPRKLEDRKNPKELRKAQEAPEAHQKPETPSCHFLRNSFWFFNRTIRDHQKDNFFFSGGLRGLQLRQDDGRNARDHGARARSHAVRRRTSRTPFTRKVGLQTNGHATTPGEEHMEVHGCF